MLSDVVVSLYSLVIFTITSKSVHLRVQKFMYCFLIMLILTKKKKKKKDRPKKFIGL
jgi:hypothetical protein